MEIARREARIDQLVGEMLVEGLLNDQFQLVQTTRAAGDLEMVAKMILFYWVQVRMHIRPIAYYLTKPNVDYARASVRAGQLGIHSCSIGAQSILHACRSLMQTCARRSMHQCVGAFYTLDYECHRLLCKLLLVLQLEMEILFLRRQR